MILFYDTGIILSESGGNYYSANIKHYPFSFLIQINSLCWTSLDAFGTIMEFAGTTVDNVDRGMNVRNVYVYGFAGFQFCIVFIWYFHRTNSCARVASNTLRFINVSGFLFYCNVVVSRDSFNTHGF